MSKIYLASFANQCITEKATMRKPNCKDNVSDDQLFENNDNYIKHLASLSTYPFPVSKEMDGKELVEGVDFKLQCEVYGAVEPNEWWPITKELYDLENDLPKRIIALPLQPGNGGEEKDGTIIEFLLGEKSFNGVWYGDNIAGQAPFWWRKHLRKLASPSSPDVAEMAKDVYAGFNIVFIKDEKQERGRALMMLHPDDYKIVKEKYK